MERMVIIHGECCMNGIQCIYTIIWLTIRGKEKMIHAIFILQAQTILVWWTRLKRWWKETLPWLVVWNCIQTFCLLKFFIECPRIIHCPVRIEMLVLANFSSVSKYPAIKLHPPAWAAVHTLSDKFFTFIPIVFALILKLFGRALLIKHQECFCWQPAYSIAFLCVLISRHISELVASPPFSTMLSRCLVDKL